MDTHDDLKREMARFEAARVGARVELAPTPIDDILAVFDGTDQDATVRALASAMAAQTGAMVRELRAPDAAPQSDFLSAILSASVEADVVVAPCPFGRDYEREGAESLSTTVDLLLSRCDAAVCLARAPVADPKRCVTHPLVALQVHRHRKVEATAFAVSLARDGGALALLSVVDPNVAVKREELVGRFLDPRDLSAEVLESLASARAAALTSALQRHAREWRLRAQVKFGVGDVVELALEAANDRGALLVVGHARDATAESAQVARRLVLRSALPVLLV